MLARDIEMFIEHCGLKGLSTKTINSYEQTLRLFMQYMDEQGILLTEKITHLAIQGYIKSMKKVIISITDKTTGKTFGTAWLPETAKDIGETILQYAEEGMANG